MFTILKNHEQTLKQVLKAAKPNAPIGAYANAYIETTSRTVTIICGDGSIEMIATLSDCNVQSAGVACVDAQKLGQAIAACKFECQVFFKDGFVEVKNGKSKFKLQSTDPNAYPSYPDVGNQDVLEVDANQLIAGIKSASLIAPDSDVRYFLNGVKIGDYIAATDGHRMVIIESEKTPDVIVPIGAIKLMPDHADQMFVSKSFLTIRTGDLTFKTKLIDGKFPDCKRVIKDSISFADINAESLRDAARTASITANKTTNGIRLFIDGGNATVTATSQNQEQSVIEFDGESSDQIELAFNAKYVADTMSYYSGTVKAGFSDNQMVIKTEGMINVLMAMKL